MRHKHQALSLADVVSPLILFPAPIFPFFPRFSPVFFPSARQQSTPSGRVVFATSNRFDTPRGIASSMRDEQFKRNEKASVVGWRDKARENVARETRWRVERYAAADSRAHGRNYSPGRSTRHDDTGDACRRAVYGHIYKDTRRVRARLQREIKRRTRGPAAGAGEPVHQQRRQSARFPRRLSVSARRWISPPCPGNGAPPL